MTNLSFILQAGVKIENKLSCPQYKIMVENNIVIVIINKLVTAGHMSELANILSQYIKLMICIAK